MSGVVSYSSGARRGGASRSITSGGSCSREMIRVRLDVFNGRDVVDVRTWYRSAEGEMKPGRSGLTLSVRHLPALAQALTRALVKARELGLLTGEEARE